MVKVGYQNIAVGGSLHFLIEAEGKKLVVFPSSQKAKYKRLFGLKGVNVYRLNWSETAKLKHLRQTKKRGIDA